MTTKTSRRKFTAEFKTKVVLEILKERQTLPELAKKHEVHPTQLNSWKKEFLDRSTVVFSTKPESGSQEHAGEIEKLYAVIGQLQVENSFLKKKLL